MFKVKVKSAQVPTFFSNVFPHNYQPTLHQLLNFQLILNYFKGEPVEAAEHEINLQYYYQKGIPIAIINIAQTGAGKTLAAASPCFHLGIDALLTYPTNELIFDQLSTLNRYASAFQSSHELLQVTRPTLILRRKESPLPFPSQGAMWEHILRQFTQKIICTNPDILYYSVTEAYKGTAVSTLILQGFPLIVYDEFHLAEAKQQSGILWTLALAKTFKKPKVFMFLSATPHEKLKNRIQTLGIPTISIQEIEPAITLEKLIRSPLHLVGEVDLEVHEYPAGIWFAGRWIEENLTTIRHHVDNFPNERLVIILDSVYEAKYIAELISEKIEVDVGQVHGWMNDFERRTEIKKRIVVGSSAIEVGIDFDCHFIIFEAKSWPSFLQRFGRVARKIERGRAISIVPREVLRNLQSLVANRPSITRQELTECVKSSFHSYEDFESYFKSYAAIEGKMIFDAYIEMLPRDEVLKYQDLLYGLLVKSTGVSKDLIEKLYIDTDPAIFELLKMYRGFILQCAIYDRTDLKKGWFPFKFYDIDFVLRRCNFTSISINDLKKMVDDYRKTSTLSNVNKIRADLFERDLDDMLKWISPVFAVEVHSILVKPNIYAYSLPEDEANKIRCKIGKTYGLSLNVQKAYSPQSFGQMNKLIRKWSPVAIALPRSPDIISEEYSLNPLFRLYRLKKLYRGHPTVSDWSIAFGIEAIVLDSLIKAGKINI